MNDEQLRALVRDAVARQLGRLNPPQPVLVEAPARFVQQMPVPEVSRPTLHAKASPWQDHPSHFLYVSLVPTDQACVIEPAVTCDHCGYCKSHGH